MIIYAYSLTGAQPKPVPRPGASAATPPAAPAPRSSRAGGADRLDRVTIDTDGQRFDLPTCALFIMVGAAPNTRWLARAGAVDLTRH